MIFKKAKKYLQNFRKVSLTKKSDMFKGGAKVYSVELSTGEIRALVGKLLDKKDSGMYTFEAAFSSTTNCSGYLFMVLEHAWKYNDKEVKIWVDV